MTWYVATLARYVLVEAENEVQARLRGLPALKALYAEGWEQRGHETQITIRTVRPATEDEIQLQRWHIEMVTQESRNPGDDEPASRWN